MSHYASDKRCADFSLKTHQSVWQPGKRRRKERRECGRGGQVTNGRREGRERSLRGGEEKFRPHGHF